MPYSTRPRSTAAPWLRDTATDGAARAGGGPHPDAVLRDQRRHRAVAVSRHQPVHEPPLGRGAAAVPSRPRRRAGPIPVRNLGYEEVGEIVELGSGVTDISDRPAGLRHLEPPDPPCRDRRLCARPPAPRRRRSAHRHLLAHRRRGAERRSRRPDPDRRRRRGLRAWACRARSSRRRRGPRGARVIGVDPDRGRREIALALGAARGARSCRRRRGRGDQGR